MGGNRKIGMKTFALAFFLLGVLTGVLTSSMVLWILLKYMPKLLSITTQMVTTTETITTTTPYDLCQSYFFFQDPHFLNGSDTPMAKWRSGHWNFSYPFSYEANVSNVLATLYYNESSGSGEWGGVVLLQGRLPHSWGNRSKPLIGRSRENATELEYLEFRKCAPLPPNKFFLNVKVKVITRNFTYLLKESVSTVGVDLMFGFDDANYDDKNTTHRVAIYTDVIFSRAYWLRNGQIHHNEPPEYHDSPSPYDGDWHLTLIVGKMENLDEWYVFSVDMKEIIEAIFNLTGRLTIRFYGLQAYTDGTGSYTEAVFDYVDTSIA